MRAVGGRRAGEDDATTRASSTRASWARASCAAASWAGRLVVGQGHRLGGLVDDAAVDGEVEHAQHEAEAAELGVRGLVQLGARDGLVLAEQAVEGGRDGGGARARGEAERGAVGGGQRGVALGHLHVDGRAPRSL